MATSASVVTTGTVGYELDTSDWPIVQFRFIGRLGPDEREQYLRDADSLIQGNKPFACLYDGREMIMPDASFVRRQSEWIRINREAMRELNRGTAFVTDSAMIIGLVRAVLYFQPLPVPYALFRTLPEALVWVRECVKGSAL